ncbi:hypothetical protein N9Y81_02290 [Akkermansiaceae bacterium]|jgi:hemolysin activation/secretion protein|nr:hypothetical protein [Akkermansiaceae bacterium]
MKSEMTFRALSLFLATALLLSAQEEWKPDLPDQENADGYQFSPKKTPEMPDGDNSQILIPSLLGLVVQTPDENLDRQSGKIVTGKIPAASELGDQLASHLSKPLTRDGLAFLIEVILSHYDSQGFPVVDVVVPEQDISAGLLSLEVTKGRVGKVGLQKAKWFNAELIGRGIHLKSGDVIEAKTLQRDLDWLGRNPFRQTSLFATPGDQPAVGDFLFGLKEERPWRVYTGYHNLGADIVGEDRISAGFNWGDAFGQDHLVSYQFTMGHDLDDFRAHAFSWEIPLHQSHHFLRFSGARADVRSSESGIDSEGGYRELSFAVGRPLNRWHSLRQEISLALEWKNIDNFASFGEVSLPGAEVDLVQLRLAYRADGEKWGGRLNFGSDLIFSPGKNSTSDFRQFREGADSQYALLRASTRWRRNLWDDWMLKLSFQGQYSPDRLLPSEQLGLGGFETIRGYSEREFLADSGYALSAEIGTPLISVGPLNLQPLAFLDHGTGWRHGEGSDSLSGAGLGLRLQAGQSLSGRIDWAASTEGDSRWHFGFLLNF